MITANVTTDVFSSPGSKACVTAYVFGSRWRGVLDLLTGQARTLGGVAWRFLHGEKWIAAHSTRIRGTPYPTGPTRWSNPWPEITEARQICTSPQPTRPPVSLIRRKHSVSLAFSKKHSAKTICRRLQSLLTLGKAFAEHLFFSLYRVFAILGKV